MQRVAAMTAAIFEGDRFTLLGAKHYYRFVEQNTAQRLASDLVRECRDVPMILQKHSNFLRRNLYYSLMRLTLRESVWETIIPMRSIVWLRRPILSSAYRFAAPSA